MTELTQQELLQALKSAMNATWDEVAENTGIAPRALKSYRLPESSVGHRGMDKFVRNAVEQALFHAQNRVGKTA